MVLQMFLFLPDIGISRFRCQRIGEVRYELQVAASMESLRSVTREVSGSRLFSILALSAFIRCKMDQREI